jgi:outer membrane lipoprotein LolB
MIADWSVLAVHKSLFLKAILISALLAGCAAAPIPPAVPYDYSVKGKIGIRNNNEGHSASFKWQQFGSRYAIEVWGPLGQGRTKLEGDARFMVITRGGAVQARGHPTDVMVANLGWSLPVEVLSAWLLGKAHESEVYSVMAVDPAGRISELSQLGWTVAFDRFEGALADAMPRRIKARKGAEAITVVVSEFEQ